jgi:hypothetical protein
MRANFLGMTANAPELRWAEAKAGDEIGAGGVRVGVLIFLAHVNSFGPEFAEEARARQQMSEDGIQVEHVHTSRAGFGGPSETLDELLDHFALERIVEVNEQRSSGPSKIENVLMKHTNGQASAMFLFPLFDILSGDVREFLAQFYTDDFAEGQFGGEQQGATFAGSDVDEAEGLHAAPRGQRIDPAAAHMAEDGRSYGGIARKVNIVRVAGNKIAFADVTRSVQTMPFVEGMVDIAIGQSGSDRSDCTHQIFRVSV